MMHLRLSAGSRMPNAVHSSPLSIISLFITGLCNPQAAGRRQRVGRSVSTARPGGGHALGTGRVARLMACVWQMSSERKLERPGAPPSQRWPPHIMDCVQPLSSNKAGSQWKLALSVTDATMRQCYDAALAVQGVNSSEVVLAAQSLGSSRRLQSPLGTATTFVALKFRSAAADMFVVQQRRCCGTVQIGSFDYGHVLHCFCLHSWFVGGSYVALRSAIRRISWLSCNTSFVAVTCHWEHHV